jgi:hypothetical protein
VVKHYAGDVDYNPLALLDKNTETLTYDLLGAMLSSSDADIQMMFQAAASAEPVEQSSQAGAVGRRSMSMSRSVSVSGPVGGELDSPPRTPQASQVSPSPRRPSPRPSTLATKSISWRFTNQLGALMGMLKQTESHFIRCVKSNEKCSAQVFESSLVHKQLLYSGVFEVVKIQQSGMPCRMQHDEFTARYRCLLPSRARYSVDSPRELIARLQKQGYALEQAQMGRSLTFFKSQEQRLLETSRSDTFTKAATKMQRCSRMISHSFYYRSLVVHYRAFNGAYQGLQLSPAEVALEGFEENCTPLCRISRRAVLVRVSKQVRHEMGLLALRVQLIDQARLRLRDRSEAGVLSLQDTISRAIDLDLTSHAVVLQCKATCEGYFQAVQFSGLIDNPDNLRGLAMSHVKEGEDILKLIYIYIFICLYIYI